MKFKYIIMNKINNIETSILKFLKSISINIKKKTRKSIINNHKNSNIYVYHEIYNIYFNFYIIFLQNWKQLNINNLLIKSCSSCFMRNKYKLCLIKMIFDIKFYANYFINQIKNKINEKKINQIVLKKIISLLSSKI